MRAAVVIDYPDVRRNAKKAFGADDQTSHIDPMHCAELLVSCSRWRDTVTLDSVFVHNAIADRRDSPGDARVERARARRWRESDPRVRTRLRGLRVPRHAPSLPPEDKGIATAVALEASLLLSRGDADHVIVFTHRRDFVALGEIASARRVPGPAGLEFASWQGPRFRVTVPSLPRISNLTLSSEQFEACRATRTQGHPLA
jgi:hypothetical protein